MSISIALSADGTGMEVTLPAGNALRIPLDHRTGPLLQRLLLGQQEASVHGRERAIGSANAPVQSMIDDYLRRGGVIKRIEPISKAAPSGKISIALGELFPELSE